MAKIDNYPSWVILLWVTMAVASINWALIAQFDVNLVTEVLGESSAYYAYMAIGAVGAIDLMETFGLIDIYE